MSLFKRSPMKVFVYGGSFDPPHVGHVDIVKRLAARNDCEKVLVVPAFNHKHKSAHVGSFLQRAQMCQLAFWGIPKVEVSLVESFSNWMLDGSTFCLLATLGNHLPQTEDKPELYFVVGAMDADKIQDTWVKGYELIQHFRFLVFPRNGMVNVHAFYNKAPHILCKDWQIPYVSSTGQRSWLSKLSRKPSIGAAEFLPGSVASFLETDNFYSKEGAQ